MSLHSLSAALLTVALAPVLQSCLGGAFNMRDLTANPMDQISNSSDPEVKAAAELKERLELERQASEDREAAMSAENVLRSADSVDYSRIDHAIAIEPSNTDNYFTKAALQVASGGSVDLGLLSEARSRFHKSVGEGADDYYFKHYIAFLYRTRDRVSADNPAAGRLNEELCRQIRAARQTLPGFSVIGGGESGLKHDDDQLATCKAGKTN